jgi:hypothetical protein
MRRPPRHSIFFDADENTAQVERGTQPSTTSCLVPPSSSSQSPRMAARCLPLRTHSNAKQTVTLHGRHTHTHTDTHAHTRTHTRTHKRQPLRARSAPGEDVLDDGLAGVLEDGLLEPVRAADLGRGEDAVERELHGALVCLQQDLRVVLDLDGQVPAAAFLDLVLRPEPANHADFGVRHDRDDDWRRLRRGLPGCRGMICSHETPAASRGCCCCVQPKLLRILKELRCSAAGRPTPWAKAAKIALKNAKKENAGQQQHKKKTRHAPRRGTTLYEKLPAVLICLWPSMVTRGIIDN